MKVKNFASIVLLAFVAMACTRAGKSEKVTLTIPFANMVKGGVSAQSLRVSRIMLNITGDQIGQPIVYIWEGHDSGSPPSEIVLDVPNCNQRLVQALLVVKDTATGIEKFQYGEDTSLESRVSILTQNFGGSNIGSGGFAGRYLGVADSGKTGTVFMKFRPPQNPTKPMVVSKSEIFGGWFGFFGLQAAPGFEYEFEDGTLLFGQAIYAGTSSPLLAIQNQTMMLTVPPHANSWSMSQYEDRGSENYLLGWFGPGHTGKSVCANTTSGASITGMTKLDHSTPITWGGLTGSPTDAQAAIVVGGVDSGTFPCISGTAFSSKLILDEASLSQGGGGGAKLVGFNGPFKLQGSGTSKYSLDKSYSAPMMTLSWVYLPGANADIDGVEVFYSNTQTSTNGDPAWKEDDMVKCTSLVSSYGFLSAGKVPKATSTIAFSLPTYSSSHFAAVACPYKESIDVKSGLNVTRYFGTAAYYNNHGGGTNSGPPLMMKLSSADPRTTDTFPSPNTQRVGDCKKYKVEILNVATGAAANVASPKVFGLSGSIGDGGFFSDALCSSSEPDLSIPSGNTGYFYLQSPSVTNIYSINIDTSSEPGMNFPGYPRFDIAVAQSANAADKVMIKADSQMVFGQCYELAAALVYSPSSLAYRTSALNVPVSSGSAGNFYQKPDCTVPITSVNIPPYSSFQKFFYKPTAVPAFATGTVTGTDSAGITAGTHDTPNAANATVSSIGVGINENSGFYYSGSCYPIYVNFENSVGASIYMNSLATNYSIQVSTALGALYQDDDSCGGGGSSSLTVTYGPSNYPFIYYKSLTSGAETFTSHDTAPGSPIPDGTDPYTIY